MAWPGIATARQSMERGPMRRRPKDRAPTDRAPTDRAPTGHTATEGPMFAEALKALAAFTEEATGMPARLGARQVIAAAEATGDGRAATAKKGGGAGGGAASADPDGDLIAPDGGPLAAAVAEDVVTLSLVSVHRT